MRKIFFYILYGLVFLSLLTPLWVFSAQLFPYITSKAFYFRICIELALPFYIYLVILDLKLRPKISNPLNIAVLSFLIFNIISSFVGVNVTRSLFGNFERMGGAYYLGHLVLLYFYIQIIGKYGNNYLKKFLQGLIIIAVFVALNGISAWLGGPMLVQDPSLPDRVSSTFGNPIFFASFLIVPLFLSLYFAIAEEKNAAKFLYWISFLMQILGIYISATRGAFLGLVFALIFGLATYVLLNENKIYKKYLVNFLVLFGVFVAIFALNYSKIPKDSKVLRILKLQDNNSASRLIQWKVALRGVRDYPVFGVGPENYYVISNKYFNPEIYKYEASWFDKPHNYLLEVLVTNGLVGLLLYLGIFALGIYGFWKAYKASLFGLSEFCILIAGLIAYEVQNLTVFDTVSASVTFYILLGFSTFVWSEVEKDENGSPANKNAILFLTPAFIVALGFVGYALYTTNIIPIQISKRINFGNAYTDYDSAKASNYFNSALALPYNFDKTETVNRYSDFVSRILGDPNNKNSNEFKIKELEKASVFQKEVAEKVINNPLLWMRVAVNEMNLAVVHNTSVEASKSSIEKAVALAPKRVELLQLNIQYDNFKKDWQDSTRVAEEIYRLNPYSPKLQWQLAISYYLSDRIEEAVKMADLAIANGYRNTELNQFGWYIQYYKDKKDYKRVVPLLELAVSLEPNDLGLYYNLAVAYVQIGDYDHAIALARQIMQTDPSQKTNMEKFIKSLETK